MKQQEPRENNVERLPGDTVEGSQISLYEGALPQDSVEQGQETLSQMLWMASHGWILRCVRVCAKRTESARSGQADHSQRSGLVFPVERRWLVGIETAGCRILRVVKPEADMERVRGRERNDWIEPEDLVQQDGPD